MLVFLSLITCQLIRFNYFKLRDIVPKQLQTILKSIIYFFAFLAVLVNIAPVIFVSWTWIEPQVVVFNVSYLFNVEKIVNSSYDQIPSIALRDMTNQQAHSLSDIKVIDNMSKFEAFSKLVFLFLALSSCLSYVGFIFVLVCTYECNWLRKIKHITDDHELCEPLLRERPDTCSLEPFCINERSDSLKKISTKIYMPESIYFIVLLFLNLVLWAACFSVFWTAHFEKSHYYEGDGVKLLKWVEILSFVMYMFSLLCTIVSCFIFSKVAYSVNHRCLELYKGFIKPPDNTGSFDWLIEQDNEFTKIAQQTLYWFEIWFTMHWGFYIATSFLSIALVFDILVKHIQSELKTPSDSAIGFSETELVVVSLFTVQHCFLFLYPCFKAAAVTVSREKLIKKVNAHSGPNHPLTHNQKQIYIQHLKDKKFGFRISFFCARLRFGFNIAYISIFIGLSGVLLKLTDLF